MKPILFCLSILAAPALAQGLDLPASTSPPPALPGCTSVTIGTQTSVGCDPGATAALRAQSQASQSRAALDANAPAPRLGLYNQAATREHFARSGALLHLPPANYPSPLAPRR